MAPGVGMYVGLILIAGLLFFCFPPLLYLLVILFGVIIPLQAGSLILAIRVIFKEDADFKSAYILMALVLIITGIVFYIVALLSFNPILAYVAQFIVGALILGYIMKVDDEPIGLGKGSLVSILTTIITIGIWVFVGPLIGTLFG